MRLQSIAALLCLSTLHAAFAETICKPTKTENNGWVKQRPASPGGSIKLHIALRQADGGQDVVQHLLSISDPSGPRFRQHLQVEELASLSVPAGSSVQVVEEWLREHELLEDASGFTDVYEIETTIQQAERLLNTTYFVYSDGTQEIVRTHVACLPANVAGHIDFITPTISFPKAATSRSPRPRSHVQATDKDLRKRASCGASDQVTPTCIRQVYNISYDAQPSRVTFAVYGTEGATFKPADLQTYLSNNNPTAAKASATYQVIGNGDPAEKGGIESEFETALDTQALLGVAWPASAILYNNGGVFGPHAGQTYDNFVQFLSQLASNKTVPSVVSFSESMPEDMMDADYARRLCNMMAKVGARGVTLVFSSGDNGPNGDTPNGKHNNVFEPEFPASCPWVLAVGGTTNLADETAATKSTLDALTEAYYIASGGGFSNLFPAPQYQQSVVGKYTSSQIPASYNGVSGFNASGRGIPDVSAFSSNIPVVVGGLTLPIGGTSASTPIWASVITLLNDYEASKGRPPLGFANPWLYSLKSGLTDITTGGNNVGSCYLIGGCFLTETLGYNVTVGWDPVTGLGSPLFSDLTKELDANYTTH